MTVSNVEQAERHSRGRSLIMALGAVVLLASAVIGFEESTNPVRPFVRHIGWSVMVLLWLAILATGGGLALNRTVRRLMNDEVSLLNRRLALQAGFWTAMAVGLALYLASFQWEMSPREGLRLLIDVTIAAALARYAWLEMR